jgi:hypothetical protein
MVSVLMLGAILAAVVAAAAPTPATAPATPANVQAAVNAVAKDPDPMICRSEAESGTRLTHRVCYRKSELAQRRLEDRQALDGIQGMRQPETMGMGSMGAPR